ncbi:unnamed protein product [Dicrocoelium dendriticum]|nr:unnamed protein product [Dicrocoelium dendriticum]
MLLSMTCDFHIPSCVSYSHLAERSIASGATSAAFRAMRFLMQVDHGSSHGYKISVFLCLCGVKTRKHTKLD